MDLGALAFYVAAAVTLVAALGVVVTRNVVYSALLLVAALMLTGLVYLLLLADFLALTQILIYGGTVSVLLLFALMLTRPRDQQVLDHRGWPLAAVAAIVVLGVLVYQANATPWAPVTAPSSSTSRTSGAATTSRASSSTAASGELVRVGPAELGNALFTTWAVPFEVASLVLLVALMGALVIARSAPETE